MRGLLSFILRVYLFQSFLPCVFYFCKMRVILGLLSIVEKQCLLGGFIKKKLLAWPLGFDKDHFSKGHRVFVFCFVLGFYPMASKNTDALSLLALPGVQTNLTDSSLITQSLCRGDAGGLATSSLSEAGISQAGVRGQKV